MNLAGIQLLTRCSKDVTLLQSFWHHESRCLDYSIGVITENDTKTKPLKMINKREILSIQIKILECDKKKVNMSL